MVADAALERRPEWVIRVACAQAERILVAAQAKYYAYAVAWLERARNAYRAAGRLEEWQAYYRQLLQQHRRKYALMELLKAL